MILHAYVDVYVLCVCIVSHGHGYTTQRKVRNPKKHNEKPLAYVGTFQQKQPRAIHWNKKN